MAQQMKQEVVVDITVKGGESAAKLLDSIDAKIKSIKANARGLSTALGSLNKVNGVAKINSNLGATAKTASTAATQAKNAQAQFTKLASSANSVTWAVTPAQTQPMPAVSSGQSQGYTQAAAAATKAATAANKATPAFTKLRAALDASSKSAKGASWNFFRARAAVAAVAMVIGALGIGMKKWFDLASDYAEANHLFYTTLASSLRDVSDAEKTATIEGKDLFGNLTGESVKVTPAVKAAADSVDQMADAMMLDPTSVKRTYATFYEMANSAGMATDKVGKLSQGMTQLTYDLASLWDMPFEETASKLQSGISGISTAVKSFGIDISRTAADSWLMANGIDATYNSLDRANKMTVMYNMLMEHTITAQGDLARSALQPANMFRILGEQSRIAGRQLGAAVFPVVTKLIPLFIMLAQAIQRAAAMLSAFLGSKLGDWYTDAQAQWNSYLGNLNSSFGGVDLGEDEMEDGLDGVGDSADKAAKKLKEITDFTLPFDELHTLPNIADAGGAGGGGGGAGGGDLSGIDIPMLDPYQWDSNLNDIILADAQETLNTIKQLIDNTFGTGTVDAFKAAIKSMGDVAIANFTKIKNTVGEVMSALIGLINWPEFLRGFADGFNAVTTAAADLVTWIGGLVAKFLELEPVKQFFQDNSYTIGQFAGALAGAAAVVLGFNVAGKALKIIVSPWAKMFSMVVKPIGAVAYALTGLPSRIGALSKSFGEAGVKIGGFAGKLSGNLVNALVAVPAPAWAIIAVVAVLAAAFVNLMNTDEDFRNGVTETWNRITDSFAVVGEMIQPILDNLNEAFHRLAEAFGMNIDPATGLFDTISQMLQPALEAIIWVFEKIVYVLEGVFMVALGVVTGAISTISYVFEGFSEVINGVLGFFQGLADFLTGVFTGDLDKVKDGFQGMADGASGIVQGLFDIVTGIFKGLGDTVVNVLQAFGIDVSGIWNGIKDGISGIVDGITSFVSNGFNWLKDTVSGIFESIGKFMSDPIETAKGVISGIVDTLRNIFNFEWKLPEIKLPHFKWSTTTLLGITIPIFSGIDWYAKGGVFDKATVAGIGEAGPEAVVPLQGARMRPFAEAIAANLHNVNDTSPSASSGLNGDALVEAVSTAVYNAMIQGFPKDIKTEVNMDGVKVNKELDRIKRQQGAGTSLVSAV